MPSTIQLSDCVGKGSLNIWFQREPCFILATTVSGARREQRAETGEERRLEARRCSTLLRRGRSVVPHGAPARVSSPPIASPVTPVIGHCGIASLPHCTPVQRRPSTEPPQYWGSVQRRPSKKNGSEAVLKQRPLHQPVKRAGGVHHPASRSQHRAS